MWICRIKSKYLLYFWKLFISSDHANLTAAGESWGLNDLCHLTTAWPQRPGFPVCLFYAIETVFESVKVYARAFSFSFHTSYHRQDITEILFLWRKTNKPGNGPPPPYRQGMRGTGLRWCCKLYTMVQFQIGRNDSMGNWTTNLQIRSPNSKKVRDSNHSAIVEDAHPINAHSLD